MQSQLQPLARSGPDSSGFRPRQWVTGTIDRASFSSSLIPRGNGTLFVVVNAQLRRKTGKGDGPKVDFEISPDKRPVKIAVPADFPRALLGSAKPGTNFDGMAPSHRKIYVRWIEDAKQPETRARRLTRAVEMIEGGKKLKQPCLRVVRGDRMGSEGRWALGGGGDSCAAESSSAGGAAGRRFQLWHLC